MKELKLAVRQQMTNDSEYLALMGVPTSTPFQTFYLQPDNTPTFPETVFHFGSTGYDRSQDRHLMAADIVLNIMVWSEDDSYEDIIDRIKVLFHHKTIGTTGAHAIIMNETDELKDEEFNVYGKQVSFNVYYRRPLL
jgi:hypothetical protein